MKPITIAVLLTCYNRRTKTLDCLSALKQQSLTSTVSFHTYLVDDGSTDGTAAAVHQAYPDVHILRGDGQLFWNGGMRTAFATALEQDYDYYLWLNDDTMLYPQAVQGLLDTSVQLIRQGHDRAIVVGSTCDPDTGKFTYGGFVRGHWWRPLRFPAVEPGEKVKPCDTINGNCVLIPRAVAQIVGNLDPAFTHYLGDLDYGLRAQRQNCNIWIAPGYIGTCAPNLRPHRWNQTNSDLPWYQQWQRLGQPKGLNFSSVTLTPMGEWKVFAQRYGGVLWPIYWLFPYTRLILIPLSRLW